MNCICDVLSAISDSFHNKSKGIFVFTILFGISSWVVFSGIWVESPMLINKLPEGWKIPSMIGFVSQLAQIGPLMLFFLKCMCCSCFHGPLARKFKQKKVHDRFIIYALFFIGLIACSILAVFWDKTSFIFGKSRSAAFFTCVFFLALLDCTCTIVFLTYCGHFKGNYITSLYIGEGISSLLPSLFALIQGIDDDGDNNIECNINNQTNIILDTNYRMTRKPRFGVTVYFWLLFSTLLISFISFLVLDFWPSFQKEKLSFEKNNAISKRNIYNDTSKNEVVTTNKLLETPEMNEIANNNNNDIDKSKHSDKLFLLFAIGLVSFILYGFIPGLSSYSALPYGNKIMHLSVTLALITQPISSLIATFYEIKRTRSIFICLLIAIVISLYIVIMAIKSPCPLFVTHWIGSALIITAWVLSFGLLMYLRCCIASALKNKHSEKSLVWCGLITQIGQFIGSLFIYFLVNYATIFKETDKCNRIVC